MAAYLNSKLEGGGGIYATLGNLQTLKLLLVASETIIIHKQKDYSKLLIATSGKFRPHPLSLHICMYTHIELQPNF